MEVRIKCRGQYFLPPKPPAGVYTEVKLVAQILRSSVSVNYVYEIVIYVCEKS